MDAVKITEIITKFKNKELDFIEASLLLIILGLKVDEVKILLNIEK